MLTRGAARLVATLAPRVGTAWPAIAAVALAVVLGHSGVQHLDPSAALAAHYRAAIGTGEWTRAFGIAQMFAAGGLCFRRTRLPTACVTGAVVLAATAHAWRGGRPDDALAGLCVLAWVALIAAGEARRPGPRTGI